MKNKINSIKMSDYFQINKPKYTYLKLIPNTSIKNNKVANVANIINDVYVDINKRFKKHNKGFSYDLPAKVSFIVDINSTHANFYMIVPNLHLKEFNQKLTEAFGKITIEEVCEIKGISKDCTKYSLSYAKDDSMSLHVDRRDNDLLSNNLSVMDILQEDDRVVIVYNFIPQSKSSLMSWKNYHVKKMEEYQAGKCLDKTMTFERITSIILNILYETVDTVLNSTKWMFGDNSKNESRKRLIPVQELTKTTKDKENAEILKTQIMIYSESKSIEREKINAKTTINTFSVVGEKADNKLIAKRIIDKKSKKSIGIKKRHALNVTKDMTEKNKGKEYVNFEQYEYEGEVSKMSTYEVESNFISLPGKTIIEEHKLEATQHSETTVPEELKTGNVRYGTNTYRGKTEVITTSSDEDASCMPELIMAKMGGGKTSAFENKGVDAVNSDDSLIVLDFIKNCEMSENIMRNIKDKSKIIRINLADYFCQEGFGFNEIEALRDMNNPMSRYECATLINAQITNFIDNLGTEEFSASMGRYLDAACTAVLIHEDKSIRDIVKCLENYKDRLEYMEELSEFKLTMPEEYQELIQEDIDALEELNEYRDIKVGNKKTGEVEISGTCQSKISGIISRISMLKKSPALKFMYVRNNKNNINLAEAMQQGKAIFFEMPQNKFSSPQVKNIIVSYLFSKIMIASEVRAEIYKNEKLRRVHVICDEIQQARGSFKNIGEMCYQLRKFRVKLILSTHNFTKIAPIKDILIDAGATIMMLKGSSTKDFEVLKDEFEKQGFTKEDLVSLSNTDKYKALCLIATKKGRHGCIVELPKPVKNKIELNYDITEENNDKKIA